MLMLVMQIRRRERMLMVVDTLRTDVTWAVSGKQQWDLALCCLPFWMLSCGWQKVIQSRQYCQTSYIMHTKSQKVNVFISSCSCLYHILKADDQVLILYRNFCAISLMVELRYYWNISISGSSEISDTDLITFLYIKWVLWPMLKLKWNK